MLILADPRRRSPPAGTLFIGVGIKQIGRQTPPRHHVALLYSADQLPCRISHLEDDNKFIDCEWDSTFLWHEADALDEFDRSATVAFLLYLDRSKPTIPYGFRSVSCRFATNQLTGLLEFTAKDPGCGLTCSSFICAVFRSLSLPFLVDDSWSADRPEDAVWRASMIVDYLRTRLAPDRYSALIKGIADPRVRPEEAAAAFTQGSWPVKFADILQVAQQIVDEVEAAKLS